MVSNLSTIGFAFDDNTDFTETMIGLANAATERIPCPGGEYAIWRSATGAEIWFHLRSSPESPGEQQILGLTPFFEGSSSIAMKVVAAYTRPEDNAFEGAFHAWVAPEAVEYDADASGAYPVVFDAVDFAAHAVRDLPEIWTVRVAVFARELKAYPDAAAYQAVADRSPPLADRAFIPMGLFALAASEENGAEGGVPSSTAIFSGRVKEHAELVNEETERPFHWLLVESLEATYDVLADPEAITGNIVEGGTVEVAGLVFGRTLD